MKFVYREPNKIKDLRMRLEYRKWKFRALDEAAYFTIFQGFLEEGILRNISGNALKLYIYLGINSNNFEGVAWHSTRTISSYFGKSERTIRLWMKELQNLKLIKRMRLKYDGEVYTYLIPYKAKTTEKGMMTEGIISVDENNSLKFKFKINDKEITQYVSSGIEVEIYNYMKSSWIKGKLMINRSLDEYNFAYVFQPQVELGMKKLYLDPGIELKARINIVKMKYFFIDYN